MLALGDTLSPTPRTDRCAVGGARAPVTAATTGHRPTSQRPSHRSQRHPMDRTHWCAVARPAGVVWLVADGVFPLSALATRRHLGAGPHRPPRRGGPRRDAGRLTGDDRWHD